MKKDFDTAQQETPAVTFYDGNIVMDNGEAKIEWNDPAEGFSLQTEEELSQKEKESRMQLDPAGNKADWIRQRDINYSADRGRDRLQQYKLNAQMKLDTKRSPVCP